MSKSRVQLRGVIGAERMRFDRISIRVLESISGRSLPFRPCLPRSLFLLSSSVSVVFISPYYIMHHIFNLLYEIFNIVCNSVT